MTEEEESESAVFCLPLISQEELFFDLSDVEFVSVKDSKCNELDKRGYRDISITLRCSTIQGLAKREDVDRLVCKFGINRGYNYKALASPL